MNDPIPVTVKDIRLGWIVKFPNNLWGWSPEFDTCYPATFTGQYASDIKAERMLINHMIGIKDRLKKALE